MSDIDPMTVCIETSKFLLEHGYDHPLVGELNETAMVKVLTALKAQQKKIKKLEAVAIAARRIPERPSLTQHLRTPGFGELAAAFAALETDE